jgi:hypothetical protein
MTPNKFLCHIFVCRNIFEAQVFSSKLGVIRAIHGLNKENRDAVR